MAINLISDTETLPSSGMLEFMMKAELGDDVFRSDPTVNKLEASMAEMFGMEDALFCPSGTMTNQIAVSIHTGRLDEVICEEGSHVFQYETGGYAHNSGVAINLISGVNGKIKPEQVESAVKHKYDWLPNSRLLILESTTNRGGGSYYTLDEIKPFRELCDKHDLKLHLDGARLFNALVETGESPADYGNLFDSISICMSKGLGAPVGSVLLGTRDDLVRARRTRKVMGGGMRQAGILAAACIYAMDNNVERLKIDNDRAREIGKLLDTKSFVRKVRPVATNIVIFDLIDELSADDALAQLEQSGIRGLAFGPNTIRLVTHLNITTENYQEILKIIKDW